VSELTRDEAAAEAYRVAWQAGHDAALDKLTNLRTRLVEVEAAHMALLEAADAFLKAERAHGRCWYVPSTEATFSDAIEASRTYDDRKEASGV
jgi:hypothetical protein